MEDKKPNLIQRAITRIANKMYNTKVFKRVGTLTIALLTALSLSACNPKMPEPTPGPGVSTVCSECGGNHKTEDHGKQTEAGYSVLLHSIVEDPYYQSIVKLAKENVKPNNDPIDKYQYLLNQHPYGFLEKQGYDVEGIKNGEISCQTFSYVRADQPNRLYMVTRVSTDQNINSIKAKYYDNYLISYDLSKEEMADYKGTYAQQYIYANFLNDAISKQKKVTVHMSTITTQDVSSDVFYYAEKTGERNRYKPLKKVGEVLYVSAVAGNSGENEISIIGFTPTQAHYVTLMDGEYIYAVNNVLYNLGSTAANKVVGEPQVYDIEYFNKTWIDCADSDYTAFRRYGGYCCGNMTYEPGLKK